MAKFDEAYDRAMKRVVTEHLEEGVPEADVWGAVQERMALLYRLQSDVMESKSSESGMLAVPSRGGLVGIARRLFVPYAWGAVGLVVLVLVTIVGISGLAGRGRGGQSGSGEVSTLLFTVPVGEKGIHGNFIAGYEVDDDGTFWLGDGEGRLLHYGADGKQIEVIHPEKQEKLISFTRVGQDFWLYGHVLSKDGTAQWGVWKAGRDGNMLAEYLIPTETTAQLGTQSISVLPGLMSIKAGGNGEILAVTTGKSYDNYGDNLVESRDGTVFHAQLIDPEGKLDLKLLGGYPSGGKEYSTHIEPAANEGRGAGYVSNGDVTVVVSSALYLDGLFAQMVGTDGSLYVLSEEYKFRPNDDGSRMITSEDGHFIRRYSADGRLLNWGRLAGWVMGEVVAMKSVATGADGNVYSLNYLYDPANPGLRAVEVHRLNLFDPAQALPTAGPLPTHSKSAPTPIVGLLGDNEHLFTIQRPHDTVLSYFRQGFAVGDDGSFWVGKEAGEIDHYSSSGIKIGTINVAPEINYIGDIEAQGEYLWVAGDPLALKLDLNGNIVERHEPFKDYSYIASEPEPLLTSLDMLRVGDNGEMLFETVNGKYLRVAGQGWDIDGKPQPPALLGYPMGGKHYRKGAGRNEIIAGDVRITLELPQPVDRWHIMKVLPDGSFYVEVDTAQLAPGPTPDPAKGDLLNILPDTYQRYLLHYGADGRLIERARFSTPYQLDANARQVAAGPDGEFYAVGLVGYGVFSPGGPGQADIVRLKFYPANEPLPPVPTRLPTPVMVMPVPTVEMPAAVDVPNPIPTDWPRDGEERLSALARVLNAVAVGKVTGVSSDTYSMIYTLEVREWLKKPWQRPIGDGKAFTVSLTRSNELWQATGTDFWEDPQAEFVLFLTNSGSPEGSSLPGFSVAENREHVFKISGGKVVFAGLDKYQGWDVDTFVQEIRHFLSIAATPLPTFTIPIPPTPSPTYSGPPVTLEREGDGFRMEVRTGWVGPSKWVDASRLLLEWNSESGAESAFYLLDTVAGTLQRLDDASEYAYGFQSPDGRYRVNVERSDFDGPFQIRLLDTQRNETQVVYDTDISKRQWAGKGIYRPTDGQEMRAIEITWLNSDAFLINLYQPVALEPEGASYIPFGGNLVVAVVANRQMYLVADPGDAGPILPDGSLVIKRNWIDGPLELLAPLYTGQATQISQGGAWSTSWHLSPDGSKLAWLEMEAPPGDWSQRLPAECCSGDPHPVAKSIAVWDGSAGPNDKDAGSATANVQRYPLPVAFAGSSGSGWVEQRQPVWDSDSNTLYFAGHRDETHTGLYRLTLDGNITLLAEHEGRGGLQVVAEGQDGSIYYVLTGLSCQNCSQLIWRHPDGTVEVVYPDGVPVGWIIDMMKRLIGVKDEGLMVKDLWTGETKQVNIPETQLDLEMPDGLSIGASVELSEDGRWLRFGPWTGKVIRVVRVK